MDVAALRSKVTFQKNETVTDKYGNHKNAWTDYYTCFATIGGEGLASSKEEEVAGTTVEDFSMIVSIRYCQKAAAIDSTHFRVMFMDEIYNKMNRNVIVAELFRLQDKDYALMQVKIIPTVSPDRIIGVRTPALRAFAKSLSKDKDIDAFLSYLPHQYFDEDQLHAFVISLEKDFGKCIAEVDAFLPFIDNWATCDQLSPKAFKKEPEKLLTYIQAWIKSDKTYMVRFAIGMLMQHFLDENFDTKYSDMVAEVRSEEYYVNMMITWYFATALAKQYELVLPYLEDKRLDDWVHNKAIQKSAESFRITDEQKAYLKTLKVRQSKQR